MKNNRNDVVLSPNDPSSPTPGQGLSDSTETQSRRSVQRLVRLTDNVIQQHIHTAAATPETEEIQFVSSRVPQPLQNGPHWCKPEGIGDIQTEIWNLAWLLDKHHITDSQILDSLRRISGYVSYLEGRSRPNDPNSPTAAESEGGAQGGLWNF